MASEKDKKVYKSLSSSKAKKPKPESYSSLNAGRKKQDAVDLSDKTKPNDSGTYLNPLEKNLRRPGLVSKKDAETKEENSELSFSEKKKLEKENKKRQKAEDLINSETWLIRNGHTLTFIGVFLFSFFVFYRPYELIPGLGFLSTATFFIAVATLAVYIPTQLTTEGNLTILTTEVKCVVIIVLLALITMPIARNPGLAWDTFNDVFIKAVLIFIVMVNVIRTRKRLMAIMWIAISIGIYLSYSAVDNYQKGNFTVEEYRVGVDVQGLFGNPNEMALHLTTLIPIVLALAFISKNLIIKIIYFVLSGLFVAAIIVTFSRSGFLALVISMIFFAWKIGRNNRFKVLVIFLFLGGVIMLLAPGNYGIRLLSIFIPGLDPVGSSTQRTDNLILSLIVTLRNPWGIGMGNSVIFGVRNLQTHNAFTQVSSELGLLGILVYLIFQISPIRKLGAIERIFFDKEEYGWFYYMAIGLQASIVAFMVASFFASVAYHWFVYYIIAYAVVFRRIYQLENNSS